MSYQTSFSTNICGHYVYKSVWKSEKGEKLDCHEDDHDEAFMYENHATGVYKEEILHTNLDTNVECRIGTLVMYL